MAERSELLNLRGEHLQLLALLFLCELDQFLVLLLLEERAELVVDLVRRQLLHLNAPLVQARMQLVHLVQA